MKYKVFFTILFLINVFAVTAQIPSRAQKYFDQAMRLEAKKEHEAARTKMEKALKEYPAFADAASILGAWYFNDHQFKNSVTVFQNAYRFNKKFALPLVKSLVYSGNTNEALNIIPSGNENNEWKKLRTQALFIQQAMTRTWKDTAFNLGRPNTSDAEMFPSIIDDQKIYFTRRMNNSDEDFFTSEVDSCGGWFTGKNMGSPPNTLNQEAAQTISADGHYLFFMRCENRSENGWGQGGCDLYMCYRSDSVWSVPQSFGATINTPGYEGMPCLSPDNRELYFVSDRDGGYGGLDIWVSKFENGLWQAPRNLGPDINTAGNETAPFMHIDNKSFYFSSSGQEGMGGADLFMSKKINDSTWSKPINMGYPINTPADETGLCINTEGTKIFFASDRDSVAGNFDLYEMKLPAPLQPTPVNIFKGFVYDSLSKYRLNYASIFIKDPATNETLYHFVSNRGDGSFMITLPANKKYLVHIDRISYKDGDDTLDLTEQGLKETQEYNIALLPSDYVAPVNDSLVLAIYFPSNSAKLTDTDKITIKNALTPWVLESTPVTIYVNGYTDNTGTPMINEELSYMRAGLVAKEIEAMGIDILNIHTKGWGEADPLDLNDTEDGRSWNRRVEVIIRR